MNEYLPWLSLALLGAFHGLNPGMGWLFAVAIGLQEGTRAAVVRSLGPIAAGHLASIALVVTAASLMHLVVASDLLRYGAASVLVAFGLTKFTRFGTHPRWVGMRVTPRDLAVWSFVMATAHGAGLMLVPVVLRLADGAMSEAADSALAATHAGHAQHLASPTMPGGPSVQAIPIAELLAISLHTAAMFLVMGAVACLVFDRLGLAVLRRAWINLDRIWAGSLVVVGLLTLAL
jgi:hypothetical protein